tara:strand:- start:1482 stop:2390 length:909 start_codon:yes stop_codon:yes gene_type:complete
MPSTFSESLRLELQADGENPNTWGTVLNDNVIKLIDTAIAGYTSVDVCTGGTDVVLPLADGTDVQSRNAVLKFTGAVSANTNVIIPAKSKIYIINDASSRISDSTIIVKTSALTGGVGTTITAGSSELIYCDGVSVFGLNNLGLNLGTAAELNFGTSINELIPVSTADNRYVRVSVSSSIIGDKTFLGSATFSSKIVNTPTTLSGATSITPDFNVNNTFVVTLTANVTLQNPSNATAGQGGSIYLIQDGTGSRTVVFGDAYKFPAASAPTLSTSTSAVDLLVYNVRDVSAVDSVVIKSFGRS